MPPRRRSPHRAGGVGRMGSSRTMPPAGSPSTGDEQGERAVEVGAAAHACAPSRQRPAAPPTAPCPPRPAARRRAATPRARHLLDVRRGAGAASPRAWAPPTTAAARTWGETWSSDAARRRSSSAPRSSPAAGTTSATVGRPAVSVPVLSNSSTSAVGQPLQGGAALDDHAPLGRPGEAGDDRDRRGEDQRARRGHDQHGHGPDRDRPRPARPRRPRRQADDQEQRGVAVGQPHERGAGGLGLGHEADDAGVGAVVGRSWSPGGRRGRRRSPRRCARRHRRPLDRERLAGEGRLVEHGGAVGDQTVDGNDLARLDQQQVTGPDRPTVGGRQLTVRVPVDDPWGPLEQGLQVVAGPARGPGLERRGRWPA